MNVLPFPKRATVIRALCDGNSIRGTARIVQVDKNTVMWLGRDVGEGYFRLHDELFVGLRSNYTELDEAWSFVMKKQKRVEPSDPAEYGDQYAYVALDADRKAIISYLIGKRNERTTATFAADLRSRLRGKTQITTDGFNPYIKAIAVAFGSNADYAQLIKSYGADCTVETQRRYSPNRVLDQEVDIIIGHPDLGRISTSYVKRQNLTLRMLTRRFTRLTNGFSKTLRNHAAAMDLYVGYYNLCRIHETIGKTPAMAHRVTRHVWSVEEFISECLKRCDRGRPPVRLGDQRYEEVICKRGVCDVETAGKSA
jgi:IS1 family transposase